MSARGIGTGRSTHNASLVSEGGPSADSAHPTARAVVAMLDQCARFLDRVSDEAYSAPSEMLMGSTIGQHVRHTLDHFAAALAGLEGRPIDYDHRDRDTPIERSRLHALHALATLRDQAASIDPASASRHVHVRLMLDASGSEETLGSTLGRELAFAAHHAAHHHAMMASIAGEWGLPIPPGFGKAPSTLKHERERSR